MRRPVGPSGCRVLSPTNLSISGFYYARVRGRAYVRTSKRFIGLIGGLKALRDHADFIPTSRLLGWYEVDSRVRTRLALASKFASSATPVGDTHELRRILIRRLNAKALR